MTKSSYTLAEIKSCIYKALDEYSVNGTQTEPCASGKADIGLRMLSAINSSMARIHLSFPEFSDELTLYLPHPTILYKNELIDSSLCSGGIFSKAFSDGGKKLYFTALIAGSCTLKFSDASSVIFEESITAPASQFTRISRIITSTTDIVSFGLSGSFCVGEAVIYSGVGFAPVSAGEIPPYGKTGARLPDNFGKALALRNSAGEIRKDNYTIDGTILTTDIRNAGSVVLSYAPKIQFFDETTPDDTFLLMPDISCCALIYLAASELCPVGNGELYSRLVSKYQDIALNCYGSGVCDRNRNGFYRGDSKPHGLR